MLTLLRTPLLFFLSTPGWGLPELPAVPALPSLENVLPSLNAVVQQEGQIQQLDSKERAVQGQVQQLDQTSQVPSISGTNGAVVSLDHSLQTSNSPEGLSRGTGYTPGTYSDMDLTGGNGSGAKATVVVGGDGKVQSVTLTSAGSNYQSSDTLTANLSGGSGFAVDVSKVMARGSPEGLGQGSNYTPGTYTNVALTSESGSGSGAKATVVVGQDGKVQAVSLTDRGRDYKDTDKLSAATADLGGGSGSGFNVDIKKVTPTSTAEGLDPGKGYKPGTYTNVPLSGGSGSGAKGTVVVGEDGTVSSVSLSVFGKDYQSGESLSATDAKLGGGGGSGFSVDVSKVRSTLPSLDDVLKNVLPILGN